MEKERQLAREKAQRLTEEATLAKRKKAKGKTDVEPVEVLPDLPGEGTVPLPKGIVRVAGGFVLLNKLREPVEAKQGSQETTKGPVMPLFRVCLF